MDEIEPGSWHDGKKSRKTHYQKDESAKKDLFPQPVFHNDLIDLYTVFRDQVYSPQSVFYPCSSNDASPSKVFENVTYLDGDDRPMAQMRKAGMKALTMSIDDYVPSEEHDLLILLNPQIHSARAARFVKSAGYIIANNYHDNATQLHDQPEQFELIGTLNRHDGKIAFSQDLTDLFVEVANEAEMIEYRPDSHMFLTRMLDGKNPPIPQLKKLSTFWDKLLEWNAFMGMHMPYRTEADRYIFIKK